MELKYQPGFGNCFATEALEGALPIGQNSPQKVAYGLYAEQLSGSAFTAPRNENQKTWLYRIRPSVVHGEFKKSEQGLIRSGPFNEVPPSPNQMRWDPLPLPTEPTDFLQGLVTIAGNGSAESHRGIAVHLFVLNSPMNNRFFYNSDGEMMILPQEGDLHIRTELGEFRVGPKELLVVPRGMKFQVAPLGKMARGYVGENYGRPFRLPELGPIGANGLANPRDFKTCVASYEDKSGDFKLVTKFEGKLWTAPLSHSPFDVVAWHGNYVPYLYDLTKFNTINTVSFDHPDPSIFTVLTSPSELPGTANIDFVIFPPRWMVADNTFRPPYFHRNVMSEYMGLIHGSYDAKTQGGFLPGGGSLHNGMAAHGPDAETFDKASSAKLQPTYLSDTLAFMFESSLTFRPTAFAMSDSILQKDYLACWKNLRSHFNPKGK